MFKLIIEFIQALFNIQKEDTTNYEKKDRPDNAVKEKAIENTILNFQKVTSERCEYDDVQRGYPDYKGETVYDLPMKPGMQIKGKTAPNGLIMDSTPTWCNRFMFACMELLGYNIEPLKTYVDQFKKKIKGNADSINDRANELSKKGIIKKLDNGIVAQAEANKGKLILVTAKSFKRGISGHVALVWCGGAYDEYFGCDIIQAGWNNGLMKCREGFDWLYKHEEYFDLTNLKIN